MENRISLTAGQIIDAWRAVDLDATLPGSDGGEVSASYLAGLLPFELALHGWDFAQTCGVQLDISDEVVTYLRTLAQGFDPVGGENGSFKAAVTAPRAPQPSTSSQHHDCLLDLFGGPGRARMRTRGPIEQALFTLVLVAVDPRAHALA